MKLSFKEYLESKNRLLEAILISPIQSSVYDVNKYCKLVVISEQDKHTILLKPTQQIIVEWKYDDIIDPSPVSIRIEDSKTPNPYTTTYKTKWSGSKLASWLNKNTRVQSM